MGAAEVSFLDWTDTFSSAIVSPIKRAYYGRKPGRTSGHRLSPRLNKLPLGKPKCDMARLPGAVFLIYYLVHTRANEGSEWATRTAA